MKKRILTTKEAAAYLGIEPRELKRLKAAGHVKRLRGYKKPFKFSVNELERYLSQGLVEG